MAGRNCFALERFDLPRHSSQVASLVVRCLRMKYRIQTFYPAAGCFMNTNHEAEDLEQLKRLARSDTFAGFRIRIVDDQDRLMFAPPVQERKSGPTVEDIAAMLDVPIWPPIFLNPDENDDDDT